jgi:hypothetical protein
MEPFELVMTTLENFQEVAQKKRTREVCHHMIPDFSKPMGPIFCVSM